MKDLMIMLVLSLAAALGVFFLLYRKKTRTVKAVLLSCGAFVLCMVLCGFVYLCVYYHADEKAVSYLQDTEAVDVEKTEKGYFFDGPGTDTAFVFYPGAKVESTAYAPLMMRLAEEGTDCFLLEVPFHMAVLDVNAVSEIREKYTYDHWYAGGHSFGGVAASWYASNHPEELDGVILLASYPVSRLSDETGILSVYGSEDGVLNFSAYVESKENWPLHSAEKVIIGGNHAGFGSYGRQDGDNEALISSDEQIAETVSEISAFMKQ